MSPAALRRHFLRHLTALATTVPLLRPGSSLPGASAPLQGAPLPRETPTPAAPASAVRLSLKASVTEGMFAEVFTACAGATVLTAWAIALQLGPFLVGVMTALPFFAQFVQFPAAWLTSTFGHRRVALTAVGLSRMVMLPLCLVPWLPLTLAGQQRLLVGIAAASAVLGVVGNNAWVAWMGELVPRSLRGRFFGRRTALCTLAGTLASLVAGVLLDHSRQGSTGVGVALPLLAGLSCVVGLFTTWLMARQHDPAPGSSVIQLDFQAATVPLRDTRARKVLLYQVAWNAAVGFSAPYYTLHMIQNLGMTFVLLALYAASVAAMRMLTAPLWGRLIDRVGAQPVVLACSLGISFIPLLWLLPTAGTLWPLAFDVVMAGALWSGHGLAVFALPLSVAPRKGRPFYLAAFATAGGLSYAAASALGGALASAIPAHFTLGAHAWANLHVLFVISAVARFGAAFLATRIIEPDSRPIRSLGALLEAVWARLRPASRAQSW
ncbi:MFS transporter [Hyalangium rubrum]|uniref:MFS transporter n=1 Tax=Hyalangium rubrum TaxID=3103134 RepID=A0ABU5HEE5_9BACT|nr:MFS transporter [Hyalangium sp. s54d21]MDY7231517.1 MFS transporter [Hyalangium sp. s54d21]